VNFAIAKNISGKTRKGQIIIGNRRFNIKQAGF
jgi:hypothetical protein